MISCSCSNSRSTCRQIVIRPNKVRCLIDRNRFLESYTTEVSLKKLLIESRIEGRTVIAEETYDSGLIGITEILDKIFECIIRLTDERKIVLSIVIGRAVIRCKIRQMDIVSHIIVVIGKVSMVLHRNTEQEQRLLGLIVDIGDLMESLKIGDITSYILSVRSEVISCIELIKSEQRILLTSVPPVAVK